MAEEKKPEEKKPEPKAPNLTRALEELSKETKLQGHLLLGYLASAQGTPEPLQRAAYNLAFAVNTGLAGHKAADGLRKLKAEELASLMNSVIDDKLSPDEVATSLRQRWPEKA